MKFRVAFTLDVKDPILLMRFAESDTTSEARDFLNREAYEYLSDYLTNNGVRNNKIESGNGDQP